MPRPAIVDQSWPLAPTPISRAPLVVAVSIALLAALTIAGWWVTRSADTPAVSDEPQAVPVHAAPSSVPEPERRADEPEAETTSEAPITSAATDPPPPPAAPRPKALPVAPQPTNTSTYRRRL